MRDRIRFRHSVLLTLLLLAVVTAAALTLFPRDAEALGVSGYAQVGRLEFHYTPESGKVKARVSLASGIALPYEPKSERDEEMLFRMAELLAHDRVNILVEAKDDRIRSFQVLVR
ncbi:MAG TPA: hypothetical protein VMT00_07805 [Thermoanaerobaculia bacterium]|nr:hypothetical protein [Thermoanaerobaculia bacterium]